MVAVLVLPAACSTDGISQSTPYSAEIEAGYTGFQSPESAVTAYLEGLRDSDLNRMIEAFSDDARAEEAIGSFIALLHWLFEDFNIPFSASDLQSLEILGFIPPEALSELYLSEANQENLSRQAERLSAEQLVSRAVVFELGGEKYLLMVDVADFGGEWRISDFGGNLGALLSIASFMQGMIPPEFVGEFIEGIDLEAYMPLE